MTWPLVLSLVGWLFLLIARRGFWRARPVIEDEPVADLAHWPAVAAVVPARDEAASVARALRSILAQDYPGDLGIVLVDDHSEDDTAAIGHGLADDADGRLLVVSAPPLPDDWAGKIWALRTGLARVPDWVPFIWFTDADIVHDPGTLRRLVAKAEGDPADLVSLMVRLDVGTRLERLLIPPFVFFFQKLYPFAAVNDPGSRVAAAAGGCALVRKDALAAAGGLEAIRSELIDDVALACSIKHRPGGPHRIWLGHGRRERSLRRYRRLGESWDMVARSADEQLGHSLPLLALTILGMTLLYIVPPVGVLGGLLGAGTLPALLGMLALALMMTAYAPTARLYGIGWGWRFTLPLAAALFVAMTVSSAWRFRRGHGGRWKGRVHRAVRRKDTVV